MFIGTNGIVINENGRVLLIRRDDTRTFAPPGGGIEMGELPPENIVREVNEETGLIVTPVRLVGLHFWRGKPDGYLNFTFRCLQRGGDLATSPESPQVGFFDTHPLPSPMAAFHRKRVELALSHLGGAIHMSTHEDTLGLRVGRFLLSQVVYRYKGLQRRLRGMPRYQPPPSWEVEALVVARNPAGEVLWLKRPDSTCWQLPGGMREGIEAPWETAARYIMAQTGQAVHLSDLAGVYVEPGRPLMRLLFTADWPEGRPAPNSWEQGHFLPGREPAHCDPRHIDLATDSPQSHSKTLFRRLEPRHVHEAVDQE